MKPTNLLTCLCPHYKVSHLLSLTSLNIYTVIDTWWSTDALVHAMMLKGMVHPKQNMGEKILSLENSPF